MCLHARKVETSDESWTMHQQQMCWRLSVIGCTTPAVQFNFCEDCKHLQSINGMSGCTGSVGSCLRGRSASPGEPQQQRSVRAGQSESAFSSVSTIWRSFQVDVRNRRRASVDRLIWPGKPAPSWNSPTTVGPSARRDASDTRFRFRGPLRSAAIINHSRRLTKLGQEPGRLNRLPVSQN